MAKARQKREEEAKPQRVRLTVFLSLAAYDAISELQRRERTRTGRALPIWKAIDQAVIAYARKLGIRVDDQ